jgi:crossover junction endodeoxyribonuclease RuvC
MSSARVCGLDPGFSGALAFLHDSGAVTVYPVPILAGEFDELAFRALLDGANPGLVVMEKVHARPGNGVVSMFRFGQIYGSLISSIKLLRFRLELVAPQTWKAEVLRDTERDKQAAIDYCARAYPQASLMLPGARKPSHDIADAICLAEYGQRKFCHG